MVKTCTIETRRQALPLTPGGSVGKEFACKAGYTGGVGLIPESGRWQPPPVFLLGESPGQRSLVGYSPKRHKESDTTKHQHHIF